MNIYKGNLKLLLKTKSYFVWIRGNFYHRENGPRHAQNSGGNNGDIRSKVAFFQSSHSVSMNISSYKQTQHWAFKNEDSLT